MRHKIHWICPLVMLIFLYAVFPRCNAVSSEDVVDMLETTPYADDKKNRYLKDISFNVLSSEPSPASLCCFDICEDGRVAIGFQNDKVAVYSAEGVFMYGFSFDISGAFLLVWNGENICIYFVRSDLLGTFDSSGTCLNFKKISSTSENQTYIRKHIDVTTRKIHDIEYCLENDFPISVGAARLVAKHPDGSQQIIYDASSEHNTKTILSGLFFMVFCTFVIVILIHQYRNHKVDGNARIT